MAPFHSYFASVCALAATASALNPLVVKEQEFVDPSSNERFVIIGVDYQPGGQGAYGGNSDPLSNGTLCLRDAALMQHLGINTIRSYNVNPALNHDECVSIFAAVGIYMLLDVNSPLPGQSLDRSNPSGSYTTSYLQHIFSVVEAFKSYPNVLGFFAGNEIINDEATGMANPPYIRAVQRDLKNYISAHATRAIPVGYSAADVAQFLQDTWAYLQCDNGANDDSRSDFFGLNDYEWCGSDSSFTISGYNQLVNMFNATTVPVFFSEYGCNVPSPRVFDEVPVLYGPQMTTLSGGLVYEWTQETDNFGLLNAFPNGTASLIGDFDTLAGQYAKINTTLLESQNATATSLTPPQCNADLISADGFSTDFNIPAPPAGAAALISAGVTGVPPASLVPVTQTAVQLPVFATNGAEIVGLKIQLVSHALAPGQNDALQTGAASASASGGASATGAAATPTASGGAGRVEAGAARGVVVAAAAALGLGALVL